MNMVSDIHFINRGWIMWSSLDGESMCIDNIFEWFEHFLTMGITHENIHNILDRIIGEQASIMFDNIFGFQDNSIFLCPEDSSTFSKTLRERMPKKLRML
jgi:hypothetical protein